MSEATTPGGSLHRQPKYDPFVLRKAECYGRVRLRNVAFTDNQRFM